MEKERFKIVFEKLVQATEDEETVEAEVSIDELEEIAELSRVVIDITAPIEETYTST